MRVGWSAKGASRVLGVHVNSISQSLDPALVKIAKLWRADATRTMDAILDAVRELEAEELAQQEMPDAELRRRVDMLEGRG